MLRELGDLYIPANDRQLRAVQRRGDELDKNVRTWAQSVVDLLPRGLPLNSDETYVLSLFIAQQRRLNLQMDGSRPQADNTMWAVARQFLPFFAQPHNSDVSSTAHRLVAARLDSDLERACRFFCEDNGVRADCEEAIDWRVAISFMAQSVYSRVAAGEIRKVAMSPRRFELALVARDLAGDIEERRQRMFALNVTVDRRRR